jgi:hypothetical protein
LAMAASKASRLGLHGGPSGGFVHDPFTASNLGTTQGSASVVVVSSPKADSLSPVRVGWFESLDVRRTASAAPRAHHPQPECRHRNVIRPRIGTQHGCVGQEKPNLSFAVPNAVPNDFA